MSGATATDNATTEQTDVLLSPAAANVPLHWTSANTGATITISSPGTEQLVGLDTTGGAATLKMPALGSVQDGQPVTIFDDATIPTSWLAHTFLLAGSGADEIENPANAGQFSNTMSPLAQPGAKWSLFADPSKNRWRSSP